MCWPTWSQFFHALASVASPCSTQRTRRAPRIAEVVSALPCWQKCHNFSFRIASIILCAALRSPRFKGSGVPSDESWQVATVVERDALWLRARAAHIANDRRELVAVS
jgi:hypothetical protein